MVWWTMCVSLDHWKQAKIQWLQYPSQSNVDNVKNIRREASRYFRNKRKNTWKLKLRNLELTVRQKILGNFIGTLMTLRRVSSLAVIYWRMRRVIWLQIRTNLAGWTNHFFQLLNINRVNNVRQTELHTAEPLVPQPNAFEIELVIEI